MLTSYKKPFLPIIEFLGKKIEARQFTDSPVFIGGCARSGTTLLLSILSAHHELFTCPRELGIFNEMTQDHAGRPKPYRLDRLYRCMLTSRIPKSAARWCEKSPSNVLHIDKIAAYYEGHFRFIHIIRDGRDVILSKHPTDPSRYWVSPERWVHDVSEGLKYYDHPKVYTLKYEDLIQEYEKTITGVCEFLEIPVSGEIRDWRRNATVTRNSAYFSTVQEINSQSIGKWKQERYAERVRQLTQDARARALLDRLGYH